jgi:hypothetical protein
MRCFNQGAYPEKAKASGLARVASGFFIFGKIIQISREVIFKCYVACYVTNYVKKYPAQGGYFLFASEKPLY